MYRSIMISQRERERYQRQMALFGDEGQELLKRSHIAIAGAGGLGSPVAIYLAVAGVGTLTIMDNDVVEISNLNRQILHADRNIRERKITSAADKLHELNPDISIRVIGTTIDASNAASLVGSADGIVDAMDNFPTRYILNDVAIRKNIPLFHGAVRGFYGQASTIIPNTTACLRCIFPKAPPKETVPVVGATAGVIGSVQATEVIKFLTKRGELLKDRLLIWDGMRTQVEEIAVRRNPHCESCGAPNTATRKKR
jgi:adenylyltransferase/sulfurtransferase